MKTTAQVLRVLRAAKPVLRERFGILEVALFGSYARNAHRPDSDIDILFKPASNQFLGLAERVALEKYLHQQLETEQLDLVDYRYLNPVIAEDIAPTLIYV